MFLRNNFYLFIFGIALAIIFGVFFILGVSAASLDGLNYPITELGNCESKEACEVFCNQEANMLACINYAEKYQLISSQDAEKGRQMAKLGETAGPGSCKGEAECQSYCDSQEHMRECIEFAKKHDLMPKEELKEAEQVLKALEKGVAMPGNCSGKASCEAYCEDLSHLEECIAFGEAVGFISKDEAAIARKTGGKGPGGCKGKAECDAYCSGSAHMKECIEFGLKYDVMPPGEKEEAMMMLKAMEKGIMPPDCGGREECDVYCSQPEHMEECMNFAIAAGMMSEEEAGEAKKMMELGLTSGPGGCKSKSECDDFCDNPYNMIECMEFAVKAGMIPPEEAEGALKMAKLGLTGGPGGCKDKKECEAFCGDEANQDICMEFAVKTGMMSEEEMMKAKNMREMMDEGGPGDCQGDKCINYCDDSAHFEECTNFALEKGMIDPKEAKEMKKGYEFMQKCGDPDKCFNYCLDNQSDPNCQEFIPLSEEEVMMHKKARRPENEKPEEYRPLEVEWDEGTMYPENMRPEEYRPPEEMQSEEWKEEGLHFPEDEYRPEQDWQDMPPPEEFQRHEEIREEEYFRNEEIRNEEYREGEMPIIIPPEEIIEQVEEQVEQEIQEQIQQHQPPEDMMMLPEPMPAPEAP